MKNITRDCVQKQLVLLNQCYWNIMKECKTQNYMVLVSESKHGFLQWRGTYGYIPNAHHEDWLNKTLPWIWIMLLQHFQGAFPADQLWTGLGLRGSYRTNMYIQKLPKPEELMSVPSGEFQKINECVAERMFQDLNNTEFESTGKSPRCPLNQYNEGWGIWRYDCSELKCKSCERDSSGLEKLYHSSLIL